MRQLAQMSDFGIFIGVRKSLEAISKTVVLQNKKREIVVIIN